MATAAFSVDTFGYDYASQPKQMLAACPLCGCSGFVEVATRDRYGYESPTHVCAQCGLAFLNPRMTRDAYSEFYAGPYRSLVEGVHGREHDEERLRKVQRSYGRHLAEFLYPLHGSERTILDLGGGNGTAALMVAKQRRSMSGESVHVTVVDPSNDVLGANGCEKIRAFIEDWKPTRAVDLVLMCQTLDHVLDPRKALETARASMKDDGTFFVDIVDWLADGKKMGKVYAGIKIDHPYGWNEQTMTAALVAHGFSIVRMRYSHDGRHVGYACRKAPLGAGSHYQHGPMVLGRVRELLSK